MESSEFVEFVPGFLSLSKVDQVVLLAWHLHVHRELVSFTPAHLREAFRKAAVEAPDLSVYLPRLVSKRPPQLRQSRDHYRLAEKLKQRLDTKYGLQPSTVVVTSLLSSLPAKVPDLMERDFLSEALNCYRVKAYRAATVMAWNLAFDHLLRWLLNDIGRLSAFNDSLKVKYPKKSFIITSLDHFEDLKEFEVVETLKHSGLVSENVAGILKEKLGKRNRAAHPSNISITQYQADDVITDLVNNVVLAIN